MLQIGLECRMTVYEKWIFRLFQFLGGFRSDWIAAEFYTFSFYRYFLVMNEAFSLCDIRVCRIVFCNKSNDVVP